IAMPHILPRVKSCLLSASVYASSNEKENILPLTNTTLPTNIDSCDSDHNSTDVRSEHFVLHLNAVNETSMNANPPSVKGVASCTFRTALGHLLASLKQRDLSYARHLLSSVFPSSKDAHVKHLTSECSYCFGFLSKHPDLFAKLNVDIEQLVLDKNIDKHVWDNFLLDLEFLNLDVDLSTYLAKGDFSSWGFRSRETVTSVPPPT